MKTRITNVLTATLWLLIIAVWLPTFWTLAQLPGTWDGHKPSALLRYVEDELDTASLRASYKDSVREMADRECDEESTYHKNKYGRGRTMAEAFECITLKSIETHIGDRFIPLAVFTLLVLGGQYMLTGGLTLRFTKEKEDTKT